MSDCAANIFYNYSHSKGRTLAHDQQQQYLKKVIGVVPSDTPFKMCDLGSLDINGGVRALIPGNFQYIGVDLEIGPNVDIARPAQLLDLASEQFDFLISSELFEHTPYWKEIFAQMCRLTKPGGIVAFTCAGAGRAEHGTTRSDKGLASRLTEGCIESCSAKVLVFFLQLF
jgi:SAM-dependent methyltransferase